MENGDNDRLRTLGMIPGLKPPEGYPEVPKGVPRLPTQAELYVSIKAWFANRTTFKGLGINNDEQA